MYLGALLYRMGKNWNFLASDIFNTGHQIVQFYMFAEQGIARDARTKNVIKISPLMCSLYFNWKRRLILQGDAIFNLLYMDVRPSLRLIIFFVSISLLIASVDAAKLVF